MSGKIGTVDSLIIAAYLVGILVIGIMSVRLKKMTSDGYFPAGRGLNWSMIGTALFASNISTIFYLARTEEFNGPLYPILIITNRIK